MVRSLLPGLFLLAVLTGCAGLPMIEGMAGSPRDLTFRFEDQGALTVEVVGSFNNWKLGSTPLRKTDRATWKATVTLDPGVYQYLFVIDGRKWIQDPRSPQAIPDGFGRMNSLILVE